MEFAVWQGFVAALGPDVLECVYDDALSGTLKPDEGQVLSLA